MPAEVWGAEIQIDWLITERFTFSGAYTWLDSEYESTGEIFSCSNDLEYAPDNAFTGTLSYRHPLRGELDWYAEIDGSWTDERYADQANTVKFDSCWLSNLRLGLVSERWDIVGYINNLFDDDTIKTGFTSIDPRYIAFDPATFFGPVLPNGARLLQPDERSFGARISTT